jgi:hypothetical protein
MRVRLRPRDAFSGGPRASSAGEGIDRAQLVRHIAVAVGILGARRIADLHLVDHPANLVLYAEDVLEPTLRRLA